MADLTRRGLLTGAGAAVAALAAYSLRGPSALLPGTAGAQTTPPWNHDPMAAIGPTHWGDIGYPVCVSGMTESPVNFDPRQLGVGHGPPLFLDYTSSELAVENTGHVVEVQIPAGVSDTLQIDGDHYQLTQYHFHAPSEHAVNGRRADVEAHFVHTSAQGAQAVVGALYFIGRESNALLDRILLAAPSTAGEEVHAGDASPAELLRRIGGVSAKHGRVRVESFYSYAGSLTTPACTEGVRWSVLADGGRVSQAAVTRLHKVISRFPGSTDESSTLDARDGTTEAIRPPEEKP
jgi:carbonic anhydrase